MCFKDDSNSVGVSFQLDFGLGRTSLIPAHHKMLDGLSLLFVKMIVFLRNYWSIN